MSTKENLAEAFAGESQARNRYSYYAKQADKEGYKQIAAICTDTWGVEVRPNETTEANQPWHWVVIPAMGLCMGEIFYLKELAEQKMPAGYTIDYGGESRQYVQETSAFALTISVTAQALP